MNQADLDYQALRLAQSTDFLTIQHRYAEYRQFQTLMEWLKHATDGSLMQDEGADYHTACHIACARAIGKLNEVSDLSVRFNYRDSTPATLFVTDRQGQLLGISLNQLLDSIERQQLACFAAPIPTA